MFNFILADGMKMMKSKAMKILFVCTTLCAAIMTIMTYFIESGLLDTGLSSIGFMFSDVNIISILGAVVAGIFISGDFENKTIHSAISSGYSRGSIIIGKAIVFFGAIAILLLPYAVATGIALCIGAGFDMGSVGVGFLNLITREAGTDLSVGMLFKLIAVMLTLIIVYMAQLSLCVPLALVLKKPAFVVAIYYAMTILSAQLAGLRGSSSTFDRLYALTPFGGNHSFVTLGTGARDMWRAIGVSIGFMIIVLLVTYSLFRKSDIQ